MRTIERIKLRLENRNIAGVVMQAFDWVTKTVSQLIEHVTLSRVGYSVFIILVIAVLVRSLISTWQSGKITVGDFNYYSDGTKKADFGEQMRAETFEFYNLIVRLIQNEAERTKFESGEPNKGEEDRSDRLPPIRNEQLAELSSKSSELQQLEITVQGVNIRNLFSALGGLVTPSPRELKASIFSGNNSRRVFVTAPSVGKGKETRPVPALLSGAVESDTATAFRIACYMLWSQWDGAKSDSVFGVNFSEFCRVARLLYIRSTFDALPSYEFQRQKYKDDVDFLREMFQAAALAQPEYGLVYSSLRGLERYVGDEKVALSATTTATIGSLVDLISFFAMRPTLRYTDWIKHLPPEVTERKVIDRAYFADQISTDCETTDSSDRQRDVPDKVKHQYDNVVRIISGQDKQLLVRTGIIVADDAVITVGSYKRQLQMLPAGTEVQVVSCGKVVETHKMESVAPASPAGKSPYLRLVVPGVKVKTPAPAFPTDDKTPWKGDPLFVVGYLERSDGLFRDRSETRKIGVDNNDRLVFRARELPSWTSVGEGDDDAVRFDLDIPVASGMIGSPIFSRKGQLVGLLDIGQYLTRGMILSVALSAQPLFAEPVVPKH